MAISLTTPMPLQESVKQLSAKTPVGSALKSAEWAQLPVELRETAFFSSTVTDMRILALAKEKIDARIGMLKEAVANGEAWVDRSSFVGDMKKELVASGYVPPADVAAGSLQDVSSAIRLKLIFDQNVQSAEGYARWRAGQDPDALDNFPALRLLRIESRIVPRDWQTRWQEAGDATGWVGATPDDHVALKGSPIWKALSRFDRPWPPFDFNSGMGVEDVDRDEAISLGLLQPGEMPAAATADFTENLKASIAGLDPVWKAGLQEIFGKQIGFRGTDVFWKGGKK